MLMKRHLFITRPHKSPRTHSSTRNLDAADPQKTGALTTLRQEHASRSARYYRYTLQYTCGKSFYVICIFFRQGGDGMSQAISTMIRTRFEAINRESAIFSFHSQLFEVYNLFRTSWSLEAIDQRHLACHIGTTSHAISRILLQFLLIIRFESIFDPKAEVFRVPLKTR